MSEQALEKLRKILQEKLPDPEVQALLSSLEATIASGDSSVAIQKASDTVIITGSKNQVTIQSGADEETLRSLIRMIQFGDVDEAHLLVTKLNIARLKGEEGDRKTGSFYTYNLWLEDVSLEDSEDFIEGEIPKGTLRKRHVQKYAIKGKWDSRVYKEINAFGVRVDTPWGHKKKPNGQFTVKVEIVNGRATKIKVDVAHYDDSANNYAAEKAEQLIQSEITKILRII